MNSKNFARDQIFELSDQVLSQEVRGETVLLDLASEKYFGLDPVATRVWQLLEAGMTLGDVFETLLGEFDVEPGQLEDDIHSLLVSLNEAGLIRPSARPVES
ncbi:PqqD family protein [Wenzhouxiangellaceae bacterium CH-27]|uniref:PqqD family protein n=1 Tax=Elongatibacter sediminis TaxID=3119006 RepID=A0AAW9RBC0_9GAMM